MVKNAMDSSLGVSLTVSPSAAPWRRGRGSQVSRGTYRRCWSRCFIRLELKSVSAAGVSAVRKGAGHHYAGRAGPRPLWYYKGMPAEALSEELFWLRSTFPWSLTVCRPEHISLATNCLAKQIFKNEERAGRIMPPAKERRSHMDTMTRNHIFMENIDLINCTAPPPGFLL